MVHTSPRVCQKSEHNAAQVGGSLTEHERAARDDAGDDRQAVSQDVTRPAKPVYEDAPAFASPTTDRSGMPLLWGGRAIGLCHTITPPCTGSLADLSGSRGIQQRGELRRREGDGHHVLHGWGRTVKAQARRSLAVLAHTGKGELRESI